MSNQEERPRAHVYPDLEQFLEFAKERTTTARWFEELNGVIQADIHFVIAGNERVAVYRTDTDAKIKYDEKKLKELKVRLEQHEFPQKIDQPYMPLREYLELKARTAKAATGGS